MRGRCHSRHRRIRACRTVMAGAVRTGFTPCARGSPNAACSSLCSGQGLYRGGGKLVRRVGPQQVTQIDLRPSVEKTEAAKTQATATRIARLNLPWLSVVAQVTPRTRKTIPIIPQILRGQGPVIDRTVSSL